MNPTTNKDAKVQELNALALTRRGRFYYCQRDRRFRLLRFNTLHTFTGLIEAEKLLNSLPIPPPEQPRPPRPRGVELYGVPQSVTSNVYRSGR
jgi:hypothetical protein